MLSKLALGMRPNSFPCLHTTHKCWYYTFTYWASSPIPSASSSL